MSYQVLARKWRPDTFEQVVGQTTVTRTLQNAIGAGRIGHAFLLSGPRGVGKTTSARILAKALNCSAGPEPRPDPCGECSSCVEIKSGTSLDVQEIDGATHNGVEQVRELRESARYNPARDRFKIWIIDEVHMLSQGAFNALLKTLEEPPPRVKFIFATTEYHKIPDTILSRCQQHDFRLVPAAELKAHLREVAKGEAADVSDEALARIARAAEGSVRDALSLFDQVLSFSGEKVKDEDVAALLGLIDRELLVAVSRGVADSDAVSLLELVERLADHGADYRAFARELLLHFRELLLLAIVPEDSALLRQIVPEERERLRTIAAAYSEDDLLRVLDSLAHADGELRAAADPRVTLELQLLRLVQMRRLQPFAELVERVERLASGQPLPAPAPRVTPRPAAAPAPRPRPVAAPDPPPRARTGRPAATGEPAPEAAAPTRASEAPRAAPPADEAAGLLQGILEAAQERPSLLHPLRDARPELGEGATLVLEIDPELLPFAQTHQDDYAALARQAAGRPLGVRFTARGAAAAEPEASPEEAKQERLMKDATREPAVQEVLDLFNGRVVGVREAD